MIFISSVAKLTCLGFTPTVNDCRQQIYSWLLILGLSIVLGSNGYANNKQTGTGQYLIPSNSKTSLLVDSFNSEGLIQLPPILAAEQIKAKTYLARDSIHYQPMPEGTEQIEIQLGKASDIIQIERQGNNLILRLLTTEVEPGLIYQQQSSGRLLRSVYADNKGKYAVISVEVNQDFEYQSYQLGNKLTLKIKPALSLTRLSSLQKQYKGQPISVDFQNVEVRSVLHLLAQVMETNIVASDEVTGTIMLNLINVPSDQALDIILDSKHLGKQQNGKVILVAPLAELAKQQDNLLKAEQRKMALMPLRTEYIRLNYADASKISALIEKTSSNKQLRTALVPNPALPTTTRLTTAYPTSLLSERGVMAVDKRTNTLIIKDTAASIASIRGLIAKIDIAVQQVMIEARIVSATDNFSKELGVKWGVLSKGVADNDTLLVGGSDQTLADLKKFSMRNTTFQGNPVTRPDYNVSRPDNLNIDLGIANPAGRIAFGILAMSDLMIDLELSAMQAEGRGEVISTPKILTMDKQTARVSSGTKIPYQSESEGGGTITQFEEALLSLEVTPNITPEGRILLQLNIENGRPNPLSSGVILIDTDRLSTQVSVADGQTIVLGGIYRNQIFNNVEKVPFFGDIPYVGRLFKKDMRRNDKQELLIFVTPTLINGDVF